MHADVIIEVPFHDVDTMNVVWHGHYLKYFEIARCKLLDQFHYNYNQMRDSGFAWPVIESYIGTAVSTIDVGRSRSIRVAIVNQVVGRS